MEKLEYSTSNKIEKESEIDVDVYMGACNNAQVMFWMVPEVVEPESVDKVS